MRSTFKDSALAILASAQIFGNTEPALALDAPSAAFSSPSSSTLSTERHARNLLATTPLVTENMPCHLTRISDSVFLSVAHVPLPTQAQRFAIAALEDISPFDLRLQSFAQSRNSSLSEMEYHPRAQKWTERNLAFVVKPSASLFQRNEVIPVALVPSVERKSASADAWYRELAFKDGHSLHVGDSGLPVYLVDEYGNLALCGIVSNGVRTDPSHALAIDLTHPLISEALEQIEADSKKWQTPPAQGWSRYAEHGLLGGTLLLAILINERRRHARAS